MAACDRSTSKPKNIAAHANKINIAANKTTAKIAIAATGMTIPSGKPGTGKGKPGASVPVGEKPKTKCAACGLEDHSNLLFYTHLTKYIPSLERV